MYAVFATGGKQVLVAPGDLVNVEKIEAQVGDKIIFEQVLLMKEDGQAATIGKPYVEKLCVETEVINQDRHKKIDVFTFKNKGYRRELGHRQPFTCVKVLRIGPNQGAKHGA